jgi:TRAP-type C4-dicarboxylate transport system permease large subunit
MTVIIFFLVLLASSAVRLSAPFSLLASGVSVLIYSAGVADALEKTARAFLSGGNIFVTIVMFAVAGELARVMGAQSTLRRLMQSVLAGTRAAPVLAPVLAATLQGPLLLRPGLSFAQENALEAERMLDTMESQGLRRDMGWQGLAAAGACAIVFPPGYLVVLAGIGLQLGVSNLMIAMIFPALALLVLLTITCLAVSRLQPLHPLPRMLTTRIAQMRRDHRGRGTQLIAPILILLLLLNSMATPTESAALIVPLAFIIAWFQPLRPRFRDIVVALRQAAVVSAKFYFLLGTVGVVLWAFVAKGDLQLIRSAVLTGLPEAAVQPLTLLLTPALLSALLGPPLGLMLSCAFVPQSGGLTQAVLLLLATSFGAIIGLLCRTPKPLRPPSAGQRIKEAVFWTAPFILAWLATWRFRWMSEALPHAVWSALF